MDIRLVDRSRDITQVPTKAPFIAALAGVKSTDLFEVMRHLARDADPAQSEFRCDREFRDALDAQVVSDLRTTFAPYREGEPLGDSFLDIPIVVED